jgi:hypothetical protein
MYLAYNAVVCNLDKLRDFHPSVETIKSKHEAYYPELTGDYAWKWREGLMNHCVENRLNFIMEVTFANGADINSIIRGLRERDYRVELKLLAVHPRLSLLGTQVRYEKQKLEEASGRIIDKEAHDDRYAKLIPSLMIVQAAALYQKMQIYGRNIASDRFKGTEGVHLIATNPQNALMVFQEVFDQPWPKKMIDFFEQETQEVIELKKARNAPALEIAKFRTDIKEEYSTPRQLEQLALRLSGKLPHINIIGTDFTIDWSARELRETANTANRISLKDMHRTGNGDYFSFFYDVQKRSEYMPGKNLLNYPENVVLVQLPNELELDPLAVAQENQLDEAAFLKEHPIRNKLDATILPLSDSGLHKLITSNIQRAGEQERHISR